MKTKTPKTKVPKIKRRASEPRQITLADLRASRWRRMAFDHFVGMLTEFYENKLTLVEMDVDDHSRASVWCNEDGFPELLIVTEHPDFSYCFQSNV